MKNNIEHEYLRKNSRFEIERILLNSLSDAELKDFIQELYEEYKELENILKEKHESITTRYS
jgi:hypothetical protein